jgi:hypothetical protein
MLCRWRCQGSSWDLLREFTVADNQTTGPAELVTQQADRSDNQFLLLLRAISEPRSRLRKGSGIQRWLSGRPSVVRR